MSLLTLTRRIISIPFKTSNNFHKGIYFFSKSNPFMTSQCLFRLRWCVASIERFPTITASDYPMKSQHRLYAQSKDTDSPELNKGGTISGVGIRKIDTTNERGYFPKTSKARIDQIKQMLKNKAMLKGTEESGKPPK